MATDRTEAAGPAGELIMALQAYEAQQALWAEEVARRWGWRVANAIYHETQRRVGRLEMSLIMERGGCAAPCSDGERVALLRKAAALFHPGGGPESWELQEDGGGALALEVRACPAFARYEATDWQGLTACGCFSRRLGWYEAMGLDVQEELQATRKWGDESCRMVLRFPTASEDVGPPETAAPRDGLAADFGSS